MFSSSMVLQAPSSPPGGTNPKPDLTVPGLPNLRCFTRTSPAGGPNMFCLPVGGANGSSTFGTGTSSAFSLLLPRTRCSGRSLMFSDDFLEIKSVIEANVMGDATSLANGGTSVAGGAGFGTGLWQDQVVCLRLDRTILLRRGRNRGCRLFRKLDNKNLFPVIIRSLSTGLALVRLLLRG